MCDSDATNMIINLLDYHSRFIEIASIETNQIINRDNDDKNKLSKGIDYAIKKNVLQNSDNKHNNKINNKIDVYGKTPDDIADEIISKINNISSNNVIIIHGLSGTGKGTVAKTLQKKINDTNNSSNTIIWSNGNIFRTITLLAITQCEQQHITFSEDFLTCENINNIMKCLSFVKNNYTYDIYINGFGINSFMNDIQNTLLKSSYISKYVPTIAYHTQGEVINFTNNVISTIISLDVNSKCNIIIEGREETMNYIHTDHRFELLLSNSELIGKRRLAQKMIPLLQRNIHGNDISIDDLLEILEVIAKTQ